MKPITFNTPMYDSCQFCTFLKNKSCTYTQICLGYDPEMVAEGSKLINERFFELI